MKIDGKYALDILYDTIPSDYLQTEIDTCWVNVGGENPSEYVKKYKGRAPVVHLKDFHLSGKRPDRLYALIGLDEDEAQEEASTFEFRPVGHGMQNIPAIIEAAEASGAKWLVVEQDRSVGRTPLEAVQMSIEYLKG
jgi:sugar phosphate isomerase/epimerase